jgi:uncharacterized membrane protein YgaE (UPF0421/DUF939 family)
MIDNKPAFKRSIYSSVAKLLSVGLGAGAGSIIHQMVGGGFNGWSIAGGLAIISFILMWYAEYQKEKNR